MFIFDIYIAVYSWMDILSHVEPCFDLCLISFAAYFLAHGEALIIGDDTESGFHRGLI